MPTLLFSHQSTVLKAFAVLANAAPGKTNYDSHVKFIENFKNDAGFNTTPYLNELNKIFAGASDKSLGDLMLANLGLTSVFTSAQAQAYIAGNAGNRVGAILNVADIVLNYAGADANVLAAKSALSNKIDFSYNWSTTNAASSNFPSTFDLTTFNLTTAVETLIGTSGNDLFQGYIADNGNTLNSGDNIQGGAGVDTLFADIGSSQSFAITAQTTGIENATFRVQANGSDGQDNNTKPVQVEIDAQRMNSVSTWTNSNSRADLVIEDVRIADGAKTKDVTIVMESTDPGNVDFGVYFDQHSLRNASSGNTTLTINVMDTGAAGAAATAATPLLNNPYDQFKLGINGVLSTIQLDKTAVAAADTYAALLTVFQNALAGTGIVAALGADFTIVDPISNTNVTGKSIVLTGGAGANITAPTGSGWYNTTGASVPPTSNIYTTYGTGASSVTELVTSTIVLDDVGRGSTGGDLVVGGLSVGATSTSRGVERFEIEVRDNSKLQTINSTNDALREVTIKNGVTTNTEANQGVYDQTVANAGNLTVNGNANPTNHVIGETTPGVGSDALLPGLDALHHNDKFGFTDVRLIDASAMTGKLAFTAQITEASLKKYVNLADTQSNPAADVAGAGNVNYNVKGANFAYTGGSNADTMKVLIDSAVAASTTLTGQSDFSIVLDGGAGNDVITTNIGGNETAAWLIDQRQNANVRIEGGEGNDTITTTGAGDVIINAGAGNDTVFADNSGTIATTWIVNATNTDLADLSTAAATSTFLYKGKLTVAFSGAGLTGLGGGVTAGAADSATAYTNGFEVTVDIPTGANYGVTQLHLNQAIKAAINDNAVLNKLLLANDGPAGTLTIKSLIDGAFNPNDLSMTVSTPTLTATEETAALAALKVFAHNSSLVTGDAQLANNASITTLNAISGMSAAANGAGSVLDGTVAGTAEIQAIDFTGAAAASVAGSFTVAGVTITVAAPDLVSDATFAAAVAAQLTADATATPIGRATATSAGALVTVTYDVADGNVAQLTVVDGTASLAPVAPLVATLVGGIATTFNTGAISTAESDNKINLGSGTDVVVLGTGALSNDTLVFSGADVGVNTVVNFTDGVAANADKLDFKSYLTSLKSSNLTSVSTESQVRIATTLNADADAEANSVSIISGVTFDATETFAGLNATNLLAALNSTNVAGAADYGTIAVGTLDALDGFYTSTAGANYLVGGIGKAMVMVENTANQGEYKVFELTFNGTATGATAADFTAATLIGTVDFGNQLDGLVVGNLA